MRMMMMRSQLLCEEKNELGGRFGFLRPYVPFSHMDASAPDVC